MNKNLLHSCNKWHIGQVQTIDLYSMRVTNRITGRPVIQALLDSRVILDSLAQLAQPALKVIKV